MRFKLQTDYALKALLYLTTHQGKNCTTEEIANLYQISAAHLGRVIRRLQGYGYVKAIRGRRGGVRLNCDPAGLTLGQVVETLEEGGNLLELPSEGGEGAWTQAQRMKAVLRRGQGLFLNYLFQVTLAEMCEMGSGDAQPERDASEEAAPTTGPEPLMQPTPSGDESPAALSESPVDSMAMMEQAQTQLSTIPEEREPVTHSPSMY